MAFRPCQLSEMLVSYSYVLSRTGDDPSVMMVSGGSAGSLLALSMPLCLSCPKPSSCPSPTPPSWANTAGRMRIARAHYIARRRRKAETWWPHPGFLPAEGSGAAGSWGFVCVCIYNLHLKAILDIFTLL